MSNKITARYVDTCLSDYLTDSCNRPGQTLCLAGLGGYRDLTVDELYDSIDWDSGLPDDADLEDQIRAALSEAIAGVDLRYIDGDGNRQDETPEDRDGDEPYLYVVIEWNPTIIKMRLTVDVEYYLNDEDPLDVGDTMEGAVRDAMGKGMFGYGLDSTVKTWGATAEEVTAE
jgi:hypothetical protein